MSEATIAIEQNGEQLVSLLARTERPLRLGLVLACLMLTGSFAAIAAFHIKDRYQVNPTASVHLALADYARRGLLYPQVFDGEKYAGTRYMPLAFLPFAGTASLTGGDYLFGAKLWTAALTAILCLQLFLLLRRYSCPPLIAWALLCLMLASDCTFELFLTTRSDIFPVILQLGAVMLLTRSTSTPRTVTAAVFCALALFSKMTAVWGVVLLFCYLFARQRRQSLLFAGVYVGCALLLLGLFQWLSSGRMLENLLALSLPDSDPLAIRIGRAGSKLLRYLTGDVPLAVILMPSVLLSLLLGWRQQFTIYHYALFLFVPIVLVVFADKGGYINHLIDLVVLSVVLTGALWPRLIGPSSPLAQVRPVALLVLLWALVAAWKTNLATPLKGLSSHESSARGAFAAKPLASLFGDDARILSEDPMLELSRGQTPSVMDAYMYARLAEARSAAARHLLQRIERRDFTCIATQRNINLHDRTDLNYHFDLQLGQTVVHAIRQNYVYKAHANGYYVYVPREDKPRVNARGLATLR